MWPSYPLPFRFFFWFHWLANICNLKWLWVLFGWPEISLAAGQSVWAWHLKGPDHDWTPGHPASTYSGQEQQVFGCVSFFFFCWVSWSEIVWFIDNFQKGGMELREQSKFWHWVLSAGIQIYWWANRKHGQYGYRKRSLVVVVIAAAPFPIRFHSVVSAFFQIPRHICCSILIKNAWNVYPYI